MKYLLILALAYFIFRFWNINKTATRISEKKHGYSQEEDEYVSYEEVEDDDNSSDD